MLTLLTVFSALVLTLIILVPSRPSRENEPLAPAARARWGLTAVWRAPTRPMMVTFVRPAPA